MDLGGSIANSVAAVDVLSRAMRATMWSTRELTEAMNRVAIITVEVITEGEIEAAWEEWSRFIKNKRSPPVLPLIPKPRPSRAIDVESL